MTDPNKTSNAFHAVVHGRVQRVGYRVYTRESAARHKITGWVKNLPEGTVEVYAEGDEVDLTEFLTDLYRGPVLSHIENIDIHWKNSEPNHHNFQILR